MLAPSSKCQPPEIVPVTNSKPGPRNNFPVPIPFPYLAPCISPPVTVPTNRSTLPLLPIRSLHATLVGRKSENPPVCLNFSRQQCWRCWPVLEGKTAINSDNAIFRSLWLQFLIITSLFDKCPQDLHTNWEPKWRHYCFSNHVFANFVHMRHDEMDLY